MSVGLLFCPVVSIKVTLHFDCPVVYLLGKVQHQRGPERLAIKATGLKGMGLKGKGLNVVHPSSSSVVSHSMGCLNCLTALICLFHKERICNEMFSIWKIKNNYIVGEGTKITVVAASFTKVSSSSVPSLSMRH
jgi:hypothetical protein